MEKVKQYPKTRVLRTPAKQEFAPKIPPPSSTLSEKRSHIMHLQAALIELSNEPDVNSFIAYYESILFDHPMRIIYRKPNGEEGVEELSREEDTIMSKVGRNFFRQFMRFAAYFWQLREKDGVVYPEIPLTNGLLGVTKDGERELQWFPITKHRGSRQLHISAVADPYVIVKLKSVPDYERRMFRSPLLPVLKYYNRFHVLSRVMEDMTVQQQTPWCYLQQQFPPIPGHDPDEVEGIYSQMIELLVEDLPHRDKTHKGEFRGHRQLEALQLHYNIKATDIITRMNPKTLTRDRLSTTMKRDTVTKQHGVPFYNKMTSNIPGIYNPYAPQRITEFGPAVRPVFIRQPPPNIAVVKDAYERYVNMVNKLFGIINVRNLHNTRMGSNMTMRTFNDNILSKQGILEEMLTTCYRSKLAAEYHIHLKNGEVDNRYDIFIGIQLQPHLYLSDSTIPILSEIYAAQPESFIDIMERVTGLTLDPLKSSGKSPPSAREEEEGEGEDEDVMVPGN